MKDILIWINTYNRPDELSLLLQDIVDNRGKLKIDLLIMDDCSNKSYDNVILRFKPLINIKYIKQVKNHGKYQYWRLCNKAMEQIKLSISSYRYFIKLDDDLRLTNNFFDKCINIWKTINDKSKICLNFRLDTREGCRVWTRFTPIRTTFGGIDVYKSQWVDCDFFTTRRFFDSIDFSIPFIPRTRWRNNRNKSSGVGEYFSKQLSKTFSLYLTCESLVDHCELESQMNPLEREINPLATNTFNKQSNYGLASQKMKDRKTNMVPMPNKIDKRVVYCMATHNNRRNSLEQVIDSINGQYDHLYIYSNDYNLEINNPKITVVNNQPNIGDIGKFHFIEQLNDSYVFCIDDDIIYPCNYTDKMVQKLNEYNNRCIVGILGAIILFPCHNYYKSRKHFHFHRAVTSDHIVHVLGTGTIAFDTSEIKIPRDIFKKENMADIWLAMYAQDKKIPMVMVTRQYKWLEQIPVETSIYGDNKSKLKNNAEYQTKIINDFNDKNRIILNTISG